MSLNQLINGAFNVNPFSNLILTIRLKEEVTMKKKGKGKAFIHSL